MKTGASTILIKTTVLAMIAVLCFPHSVRGQALVGALPGEFAVDNKGAANYTIPLAIPPGRGGMQPQLALHYNSNGGNGPLGTGFSLSTGFPQSITRGRSILARDGVVRGVKFDADDKFYLDGKRLLLVSGTHGQPGSVYRTEVDSFATITTFGGDGNIEGFRMINKNGTMLCFGKNVQDTAAATVYSGTDGYQMLGGETTGKAFAWVLKWVEDTVGNCIEFRYDETAYNGDGAFGAGEHVLTSVRYTGNRRLSLLPQFTVGFHYNESVNASGFPASFMRPDGGRFYKYGRHEITNARLDRISTASHDYKLEYTANTMLHLEHITLNAGGSVISTQINWGESPTPASTPTIYNTQGQYFFRNNFSGDFDGDGRMEFIASGSSNPKLLIFDGNTEREVVITGTNAANRLAGTGDFNGDGRTDIVWRLQRDGNNGGGWYVALSTGTGFSAPIKVSTNHNDYLNTRDKCATPYPLCVDVDGDGLDEIVAQETEAAINNDIFNYGWEWDTYGEALIETLTCEAGTSYMPGGTLFMCSPKIVDGVLVFTETVLGGGDSASYQNADIDGDGKADVISSSIGGVGEDEIYYINSAHATHDIYVTRNIIGQDSTWTPITSLSGCYVANSTTLSSGCTYLAGDVNGDGLDDIVVFRKGDLDGASDGWSVHLSKGDGTFDTTSFGGIPLEIGIGDSGTTIPTYKQLAGTIDYVFDPASDMNVPGGIRNFKITGATLIDYNGDGRKDFVWYSSEGGLKCLLAGRSGFDLSPISPCSTSNISTYFDSLWATSSTMANYQFATVDMAGNSRDEILIVAGREGFNRNTLVKITFPQTFPNHVHSITNALGETTGIGYALTTSDSVYTPGAPVAYPIRENRRPQPVVSDFYRDSGGGSLSDRAHFSYQYSGNRLDLSGRGPLGFHSFVTLDHQTNLFKYQFLTQSFPMTGLAMREQTYRFWQSGAQTNFRLITSHDNTVVFDEVVNPSGNAAWGTVYPFISKAVESRWEDAATAHYTLASTNSTTSQSETIFTRAKPAGAHITITAESRFDNQTATQLTLPGAYNPGDLATTGTLSTNTVTGYPDYSAFLALTFPQKITRGNLVRLSTDFGGGFTETVANTYHAPTANGITGLIASSTTAVTSPDYGTQTAPVKSYTYATIASTPTPLVATETITAADSALASTITYTRDTLGRVTTTSLAGYNNPGNPRHIGNYTTSQATAFDARFDLPTTTQNALGHTTTIAHHDTLGLPISVTDVNGAEITTVYDALGRVIQTRDELLDLQTDTTYAWTDAATTGWQSTQTVAPPANFTGALTLSSVFAVRTAVTAKPAVTIYHDRLGRVIRTIKEGYNGQLVHADTVYNNLGQIVATSLPYPAGGTPLWTKTTYDPLGRVATIIAPNGAITTHTYAGRASAVTVDASDRDPQTNVTLVDAKGRTVKVWNADNAPSTSSLNPLTGSFTEASIAYALDGFGLMRETILRGQLQHITATYDALGRQITLNDPDKGNWTYVNNALGQVVTQTDARSSITASTFDRLARPLTRVTTEVGNGPVETARWYYFDTATDAGRHLVAKGNKGWIGALQREESVTTGAPGYPAPATTTAYYYDGKGRPEITLRHIDNKWFYTTTAYDTCSRVSQVNHHWRPATDEYGGQDPLAWEDFGYTYAYDSRSYLLNLTDTTNQTRPWWQADATAGYDHLDRPVLVRKGNAHWTQRIYRPEDGVLTSIKTGPAVGGTSIQNLDYDYDGLGNLASRANGSLTETFGYDNLNRLTTRNGSVIATYAINGNITGKIDVSGNASGSYTYSATKPHAVTGAWGCTMSYDANGNLATRAGNGQTWTTNWTGFDKPRWLAKTSGVPSEATTTTIGSEFLYNANRSRVMHLEFDAMTNNVPLHYTRKKIYAAGPDVEIDYANTAPANAFPSWQRQTVRVYLNAPDGPVGAAEFTSSSTSNLNSPTPDKALVYHTDHLGSIESITDYGDTSASLALDDTGKPSRYSYDPWGERRNPDTWSGTPTTTDPGGPDGTAPRGFTSHEMLDGLGLVHMNGRIYDPLIGRMLSADPLVQYENDLQSFNRYSYVRNNPLNRIDPSGFVDVNLVSTADFGLYKSMASIPAKQPGRTSVGLHGVTDGDGFSQSSVLSLPLNTSEINTAISGNAHHTAGNMIVIYGCYGGVGQNLKELMRISRRQKSPVIAATDVVSVKTETDLVTGATTYLDSTIDSGGRWVVIENGKVRDYGTPHNAALAATQATELQDTATQARDNANQAATRASESAAAAGSAKQTASQRGATKADKQNAAQAQREAKAAQKDSKQAEAQATAAEQAAKEAERMAKILLDESKRPL